MHQPKIVLGLFLSELRPPIFLFLAILWDVAQHPTIEIQNIAKFKTIEFRGIRKGIQSFPGLSCLIRIYFVS